MEPVTNTNTRHKGCCIVREKKLETIQASRHRASGGSRLAGRLVFGDWILQQPEGLKSM